MKNDSEGTWLALFQFYAQCAEIIYSQSGEHFRVKSLPHSSLYRLVTYTKVRYNLQTGSDNLWWI